MIKLTNINKYYSSGNEKYHALRDINLTLPDKGLTFIVGKSGSGKSTLLNIIGGIDSYDSGELTINNLNTSEFTKQDFNSYRNTYIGFIFQEFNVVKNLTVWENISISLRLQNKNLSEYKDLIQSTIDIVGLTGKENRLMNQLSGGERQRVSIARALIKNPTVIIADEPTGNLDKNNRNIIMNILKEISKEKLVIIVTHDLELSKNYNDMEVTLKDGAITSITHKSELTETKEIVQDTLLPIQPTLKTSIFLSFKSLKQNLVRFIFILLFFTVALLFANTTINLYFSNTTKEYANYQSKYNNDFIVLEQENTINNETIQTGFFEVDTKNFENLIQNHNDLLTENDSKYTVYKFVDFNFKTDQNIPDNFNNFYSKSIDNIVIIESLPTFSKDYNITLVNNNMPTSKMPIGCYITDYLAESLIQVNYFNEPNSTYLRLEDYLADKYLYSPEYNNYIYFYGIIDTDYEKFLESGISNANSLASFKDNMPFYNSIFMTSNVYVETNSDKYFLSTSNFNYTEDDFIISALNKDINFKNVKVTAYNKNLNIVKGKAPVKPPEEEDLEQIAISTGFLKSVFGLTIDDISFNLNSETGEAGSDNKIYPLLNPLTDTPATFSFWGYRRILTKFSCNVVAIIEDDTPTIYFCEDTETTMYYNYLKNSFADYNNFYSTFGGNILVNISDNETVNGKLYQTLLDNNLILNNISFVKLQVVNDFISDNIILFIGIFFALCIFSVLMIFNFVVITIKNTTRDIGIYMSLGMSGIKIAFIYIFQILLISTISLIVSSIGSIVFLNALDAILSNNANEIIKTTFNITMNPIDFNIFKLTFLGFIIAFGIAYLVPILSVFVPLLRLSIKQPIDVIKES